MAKRFVLIALSLLMSPLPAAAQTGTLELHGVALSVTRQELEALTDLGRTVTSSNPAIQDNALARARRVANGADARYALATYQFAIGQRRRDDAISGPALDVLLESRRAPAHLLAGYVDARAGVALRAGDMATADRLWSGLVEQRPNDPQLLYNLVQSRAARGDVPGALAFMQRAIAARTAAGTAGPVPVNWYRQWLSIAVNAEQNDQATAAARALLAAYPTTEQWRFALNAWRPRIVPESAAEVELMRLMRATGTLAQSSEYLRFVQLLMRVGAPQEGRAVLDEGLARGIVDRAGPNVAAIGAELARPAAAPPRLSPAETALRNAATAALAGQRQAAEQAFRTIISADPRSIQADLAQFWLLHLAAPRG